MRTIDADESTEPKFMERVYAVVTQIPSGRVTTYGAIARAVGHPRSARMVGWAVNNPPPEVGACCHRVVNRIGFLSGGWSFGHPDVMRDQLRAEGVNFVDEYQVDLKRHFWDPDLESTPADEMDNLEDVAVD